VVELGDVVGALGVAELDWFGDRKVRDRGDVRNEVVVGVGVAIGGGGGVGGYGSALAPLGRGEHRRVLRVVEVGVYVLHA